MAKAAGKLAEKKRIDTKKKRGKKPSAPQPPESGDKLSFNHAMVYVKDVQRALDFYRDLLGFKMVDEFRHEGKPVYARLRAPGGDSTIALHMAGPETSLASEGVRLYFEIRELDDFWRKLQAKHFYITQMPRMMPWGWRRAYRCPILSLGTNPSFISFCNRFAGFRAPQTEELFKGIAIQIYAVHRLPRPSHSES